MWYLIILVVHGGEEGGDASLEVGRGDVVEELFGLGAAGVVGGEEDLND